MLSKLAPFVYFCWYSHFCDFSFVWLDLQQTTGKYIQVATIIIVLIHSLAHECKLQLPLPLQVWSVLAQENTMRKGFPHPDIETAIQSDCVRTATQYQSES